jgi:aminotransferase
MRASTPSTGFSASIRNRPFMPFRIFRRPGSPPWDFAKYLVKEHKVAVVPGSIFGKAGEGYVRLSFAASMDQLKEGIARIGRGVAALRGLKR